MPPLGQTLLEVLGESSGGNGVESDPCIHGVAFLGGIVVGDNSIKQVKNEKSNHFSYF